MGLHKVVNALVKIYLGRYRRELYRHYDAPLQLQQRTLRQILTANQHTVIGQEHDFAAIGRDIKSYAAKVPVRKYEAHRPYFDRIMAGEGHVLTAAPAAWVATTSGTTGAVKYLPMPQAAVTNIHLRGSWLSLAILFEKNETLEVFAKKNLLVGGAYKGLHPEAGLPSGDISAILIRNIPRFLQRFYIPDIDLATLPNYEEKIERIAVLAAREKGLTVLGGVPTWNLPLYRRVLEIHGGDNMFDVWPDAMVFKHGGVNFAPYRAQFERLFPRPDFIFQEIYNATEGFFAVQDRDDLRTMLLLLSAGVYYEFITWTDYQVGDFHAIPLAEVETDTTYVMLITTVAGLYRYPMGDLIEFTELDPFRLRILGRTQEFINAFGEDLLRCEAEAAMTEACEASGAIVRDFTVAPEYIELGRQGRHHWLVEFERSPTDLEVFNQRLDRALQEVNYNYGAKRNNDYAIARHRLTVLPEGFFRNWLRNRGKLGGQHKVPRLVNNRKLLEEMLGLLNRWT